MSETIGIDIGSHSMKVVGLTMTARGPFLTHGGMKVIPSEVDREDVNYLSEILKVLLREVGIKPAKARLTVSGSGVDVRRIIIPSMPKAELKEAIRSGKIQEIYKRRWWDGRTPLPELVEVSGEEFYGSGYDDSDRRIPDITKARTLLGWKPRYGLEETIERSMAYWFEPSAEQSEVNF